MLMKQGGGAYDTVEIIAHQCRGKRCMVKTKLYDLLTTPRDLRVASLVSTYLELLHVLGIG